MVGFKGLCSSKFLRYFTVLLLFILHSSIILSQTHSAAGVSAPNSGNAMQPKPAGTYLKLRLVDSVSGAPVEFVTVSAKYVGETTAKRFSSTDENGDAVIQNMRVGRATVTAELMGYKPKTFIADIKRGANDIGEILIQENPTLIDAVTVTAVANPMVVKKDTIEYSAAAVKVNETDMLEELLKKLPGIEIDTDGTITANGQEINKIMIDGKTFFLDDPQIATKNIPAKIVEKVRVVERKSDQAQFTGIDDGEEETVIDLGIHKGMMDGWFGNLTGGYGTDNRYQGGGMIGKFTSKTQISVIGNMNNTNNRGFRDIAGSMMGGLRIGGMGGGRNNGITESWMGGLNFSTELLDKRLKLTGNYFYSGSEKSVEEKKNKETMLGDGVSLFNNENGYDKTRTDGHRVAMEIDYSLSDNTSILFRPTFNISGGDFESGNLFETLTGTDSTNRGESRSTGVNDAYETGGMLLFRQRLGKPGRTLSIRLNYNISDNELDGANYSITRYFQDNAESGRDIVDQIYDQTEKSHTLAGRISYTEPLGKNFFVEGAYRYSYKETDSEKNTYNKDEESGKYTLKDEDYSTDYTNTFITQQYELNFMKQEAKYNFTVGASVQPSSTKSIGRGNDTTYNVLNIAPSARFDYRFSDDKFFRVRYRGRTSQPSINNLLPIPDNSDPLNVKIGNMDLNPEFSHNLNVEYRANNRKNFSWLGVRFGASYTTDKIVNRSWYDGNGVRYTQPYNENTGVYNFSGNVMFNSKIAKSNFSIMTFTNANFGNGISYVNNGNGSGTSDDYVKNITKTLSLSENLRFSYRNDYIEVIAGGRVRYQNAWYSVSSVSNAETWTNAITGSVNANIPGGFNITTDVSHTFYIGYGEGYGESSTIWNAEVSKTLFKDQFTLKARIYDILEESKNTYRTTTENYIQDVENNTLGQYVMFSLVWRFGKFSGGGPGGPGMGRRPGGPMMRR